MIFTPRIKFLITVRTAGLTFLISFDCDFFTTSSTKNCFLKKFLFTPHLYWVSCKFLMTFIASVKGITTLKLNSYNIFMGMVMFTPRMIINFYTLHPNITSQNSSFSLKSLLLLVYLFVEGNFYSSTFNTVFTASSIS